MKYFKVGVRVWRRSWFRKAKEVHETKTIAAFDIAQCFRILKDLYDGHERWQLDYVDELGDFLGEKKA